MTGKPREPWWRYVLAFVGFPLFLAALVLFGIYFAGKGQ